MIDYALYLDQIVEEKGNIPIPEHINGLNVELIDAYTSGRAIENILLPVFMALNEDDLLLSEEQLENGITVILDAFETRVLEILENEKSDFEERRRTNTGNNKNLFEVANTPNLYLSNKYTRVISENLGHKLEDIATLSPKVINPEVHLGFKIKGIDVIIYKDSAFYFCQLKTKKDTLTGSQKSRSEIELSVQTNSIFAACLSLGSGFTFNTNKPNIKRIHGKELWDMVDIDYDNLIDKLSISLQEIEEVLFHEEEE